MKLFKTALISKEALLMGFYFWLSVSALFYFSFLIFEKDYITPFNIIISALIPLILPVYLANYFFDTLFLTKKRLLFFILFAFLVFATHYLANWWFAWIIKNENIKVSFVPLMLIFSAIYIGIRYIKIALFQRILLKEEETRRMMAELMLLKSQVNPHFLFNALNSIYSLIISESPKASEATMHLSDLMRYQMESALMEKVLLKQEIEFVKSYVDFEKLRWDDKCDIKLQVIGKPGTFVLPPILLIPYIENCFKHGLGTDTKKNFIHIFILIEDGKLKLTTHNSISKTNNSIPSTNIGMKNTQKRLDVIFEKRYKLDIIKEKETFQLNLTLPL